MEYTAVIRTLGRAGEKYQRLLDSLDRQTMPPRRIIVYIAEGYPLPEETIGKEKYVYAKKGMVAQRALRYDEVDTEYMLFLDDDVYLPETAVERLFDLLRKYGAEVVSPDVFPNAERSFLGKIFMFFSGRMVARRNDGKWAYKVMRNSGYSYNANPEKDAYLSQTNAGPCFLCRKEDFLKIRFEDELWLDGVPYSLGEDQVMFYKMYRSGLKQLTAFDTGIIHLDAGTTNASHDKERNLIYSDFRFKVIFWHRFIYLPEKSVLMRLWDAVCIGYALMFALVISLVKCKFPILKVKYTAMRDAVRFIRSRDYKALPRIN